MWGFWARPSDRAIRLYLFLFCFATAKGYRFYPSRGFDLTQPSNSNQPTLATMHSQFSYIKYQISTLTSDI